MMSFRILSVALTFGLCTLLSPTLNALSDVNKSYSFKVFLKDKEIGQQQFLVSSNDTWTKVQIEAQFDVKFWLYTAYTYRHTNTEMWNGACLHSIHSQTNDNGKNFFVNGTYADNRLKLVTHEGTRSIDGCIKTFAYWDPEFLTSRSLLNSQTGEMNRVEVSHLGEEVISVRNQSTPAIHYYIAAEKFSMDLWYSAKGEWLALQSTTEGDARLRYELQ